MATGVRPWLASVTVGLALAWVVPPAHAADGGDPCPASLPADGSPCTGYAMCEYGGDVHGMCTTFAHCQSSTKWTLTPPAAGCGTSSSGCPAAFGSLDAGAACPLADPGEVCEYPEGACTCLPCRLDAGSSSTDWGCRQWSDVQAGCPVPRPLLHTPCSSEGQLCFWDACCDGIALGPPERCSSGEWWPIADPICSCAEAPLCGFGPSDAGTDASSAIDDASPGDDAAGNSDDADATVYVSPGCGCTLPLADGASPGGAVVVIALSAWLRRRRSPRPT